MILRNMIKFYSNLSGDMLPKALMSMGLITIGGLVILVIWISLLYHLITLAYGKKSWHHLQLALIFVPYLNLLWIPWALIAGNGWVKKVQMRFIHIDTLNPGMGVQILGIPLLVLYLFWAALIFFFHSQLTANLSQFDVAMYLGVIIISMMILIAFYLVYLVLFENRIRLAQHYAKLRRASIKNNAKAK